jgi:hypothetical protein
MKQGDENSHPVLSEIAQLLGDFAQLSVARPDPAATDLNGLRYEPAEKMRRA